MNSNPVKWFEIYVQDMTRAKAFYEKVFNVTLQRLGNGELEMWSFPGEVNKYGAPGALIHVPGVPSGGNSVLIYFGCKDCAVESAKAVEAGGAIYREKFSIGEFGHIALINDTEGNLIGLHNM